MNGRFCLLLLLAGALVGCGRTELFHDLSEDQANEILAVLSDPSFDADKELQGGREVAWMILVRREKVAEALETCSSRGLPRRDPPGFREVFTGGALVPTATEEQALHLTALQGELAQTLMQIDRIAAARVHIAIPEADPLARDRDVAPEPTASVFVKWQAPSEDAVFPHENDIKQLVARAVQGLDPDKVHVFHQKVASRLHAGTDPRQYGVAIPFVGRILRYEYIVGFLTVVVVALSFLLLLRLQSEKKLRRKLRQQSRS